MKGEKNKDGKEERVKERERKLRRGDGRSGIPRGARPFEFANKTAVNCILFL